MPLGVIQKPTKKKRNRLTRVSGMALLFLAPKQGGILQSSCLLDLSSLMALGQTCKANTIDEQSIILLIENEITRHHGVKTMQQAIDFWRKVFRDDRLKRWLKRDGDTTGLIKVTQEMLSTAVTYEVMLSKMLRTVPTQLGRLQLVSRKCEWTGEIVLHCAAYSGNLQSLETILAVYPEAERLRAVNVQDDDGWIALHCAAQSGNFESIQTILDVYPESERVQALIVANSFGETVLHCVAASNNVEFIKSVLSFYPESQCIQALNTQNAYRETVLDKMDANTRNTIMEWLSK